MVISALYLHLMVCIIMNLYFSSDDASMIYVCVGFGFFVEFTLNEALRFIGKKTEHLTRISDSLTRDASRIKAHIKLVLEVSRLRRVWVQDHEIVLSMYLLVPCAGLEFDPKPGPQLAVRGPAQARNNFSAQAR